MLAPPPEGAVSAPTPAPTPSGDRAEGSSDAVATRSANGLPDGEGGASTSSGVAGAGSGFAHFRPSQEAPYLFGLPSSRSLASSFGAFIVPFDGAGSRELRRIQPLRRLAGLRALQSDVLSVLGFPDFLRQARARPDRRAGGASSDVRGVLGEQATISDLADGGSLTFGNLPLLALTLVLFSSLLLVGAVLPPGVIARARLSPGDFARFRQPLALAAIGILVPVAVVALLVALS
jgi:hypothetical protein